MSFLISYNLYFSVYFVWYEDYYSSFLLLPICMEYIFPSPHFQSICVFRSEVGLLQTAIYGSCIYIHSASLCLLVRAFNPFTFKVIIDIYVPIAIFLIVWAWFCRYLFSSFVFLDYINPFNICCKSGLVVLNSLNFCLSEKLFISPSMLNEIFVEYYKLGCRFFPFSTLNISCHSLLACRISAERSAVKHIGFPLYVTCCFSLAAFTILSLCFVFFSLISMCLGVFLLGFILYGTLGLDWLFPFPCWGNFQQ